MINHAIRGIEADFGPEHANTFRRVIHPEVRADHLKVVDEEQCDGLVTCQAHART